ncbi:hypothetical protein [Frankia tisae]|nr:hypothetical protein [Frankia tisae]
MATRVSSDLWTNVAEANPDGTAFRVETQRSRALADALGVRHSDLDL